MDEETTDRSGAGISALQPLFWVSHRVLQVSNIGPSTTIPGFLEELGRNGIVEGQNLTVNRQIIDAAADANLWKKVGILLRIKSAASRIVDAKPDLVLTISTPATKYSMDKIIGAGIPVVFSCVANPPVVGCQSVTQPAPGITERPCTRTH